MDNNSNKKKNDKSKAAPGYSNDQLGENASEEFKSEKYANSTKKSTEKKS
ncbi:MAG: hypothetical protein N2645_01975 [Clostridia bacterium]|nr:hypothetical protein [Clostridia bacterium]